MTQNLFANENFFVTVRTHNTEEYIAEVNLLLKEGAGEKDLLRGLAVAHLCRDSLHKQHDHKLSSRPVVSYYEARNRLYSKFTSMKYRVDKMTFRDKVVEKAIEQINHGMGNSSCNCIHPSM